MKTLRRVLLLKKLKDKLKKPATVSEEIFSGEADQFVYKLRLSKRATNVRLQINCEGELQLILPYHLKNFNHSLFVRSKTNWIIKHLSNKKSEDFQYLGNKLVIHSNFDVFEVNTIYDLDGSVLRVNLPSGNDRNSDLVYYDWLHERALEYLPLRTYELARENSFYPSKVSVRKQKTRWGSCSLSGTISLNYKLMILRKEIIDYVIIHELCHLIELNHSKRFWNLVGDVIPDYHELRKELRRFGCEV